MLCHNGQLNEKRAPPSSLVSQLTVPPIASAIEWTIASPSPQPPVERSRLGSRRTKGSKICSRFSGAIPGPSSSTINVALFPDSSRLVSTVEWQYRRALLSKLSSTRPLSAYPTPHNGLARAFLSVPFYRALLPEYLPDALTATTAGLVR